MSYHLTHQQLVSELLLAADLVRLATDSAQEAAAQRLFEELHLELNRREEAAIAAIPPGVPAEQAMELIWSSLS